MAATATRKGLTFPALAALGLAAFGAWKWRKQQRVAGTYDGNGDGVADTPPSPSA